MPVVHSWKADLSSSRPQSFPRTSLFIVCYVRGPAPENLVLSWQPFKARIQVTQVLVPAPLAQFFV